MAGNLKAAGSEAEKVCGTMKCGCDTVVRQDVKACPDCGKAAAVILQEIRKRYKDAEEAEYLESSKTWKC